MAKHCTEKASHFAHISTHACTAGYETSLHEAAKQIIAELGYLWLPESVAAIAYPFAFTRVDIEKQRQEIRPDLTAYTNSNYPLAVEIRVTHAVDSTKQQYLHQCRLSCVEYDLSDLPRDLTYASLKKLFAQNMVPAYWIFNAKADAILTKRAEEEKRRIEKEENNKKADAARQMRELSDWVKSPHAKARQLEIKNAFNQGYILNCPIKKRGSAGVSGAQGIAFVDWDCAKCQYCTGPIQRGKTSLIGCIGHFPKLALQDKSIIKKFGGQPLFGEKFGVSIKGKLVPRQTEPESEDPF